MASLPEDMVVLAVTPVNFEEIIERSTGNPFKDPYTEDQLKEIRAQARDRGTVAMVCFMGPDFWKTAEENPGQAVHDTGDWRGDRR